jgi:hypothetical protein
MQLSSWMIFGSPSGLCFREDIKKTIDSNSNFVPHFIKEVIKFNIFTLIIKQYQKYLFK